MSADNLRIARLLDEVADLLEIQGSNPFRIRAYRNAVRTIREQAVPLRQRVADGEDLTELPTIGKDIAGCIEEIVATGGLALIDEIGEEVPRTLTELLRLPGIGAKKVRKLWEALGVTTVDELEAVVQEGRVAGLEGFGARSEEKILEGIEAYRRYQGRLRLSDADVAAADLLRHMAGAQGLERLEMAGSLRRRRETIGDLDLLATSEDPGPVMERFTAHPDVERVERSGPTRGTIVLSSGLQADLRILPADTYGAGMVYFTGSKAHNVKLRQLALESGLSVSEYGVFELQEVAAQDGLGDAPEAASQDGAERPQGGAAGTPAQAVASGERAAAPSRPLGRRVAGTTEVDVYAAVGLPWIPPELREDRGEIEAAERGDLPDLIEVGDLRGDLQMHSTWSDGNNSIEQMLEACAALGYEYFALTDHSKALAMTGGLDAAKLRRQWEEIEEVTGRHPEIRLLRSMEVDILADGSLDLEDEMLAALDLVVVSVHSRLRLPAAEQTERLLTALRHPEVNVLAHPTGRIINRRDPMDFDLGAVLNCAAEHRVALELNAHPERLDLRDTHLMEAKRRGVKVVISTDAHHAPDLALIHYGIEQARRAWLEPGDVLNTLPLEEMLAALKV